MFIPPFIGFRIVAFVLSIVVYWIIEEGPRTHKKKRINSFLSIITTLFIVFTFIKVVTKFPMLLEYPMVVLTYPSGTLEFYLGFAAMMIHYVWMTRSKENSGDFHRVMFQLIAGALFFFYFCSVLFLDQESAIELIVWFLIYLGSLMMKKQWKVVLISGVVASSVLSMAGYLSDIMEIRVDPLFYILLTIILLILTMVQRRRFTWGET